MRALLEQHTQETGQSFAPEALETVWRQTRGQPWLVNALCRRVCFDDARGRDRSRAVTADDVYEAQEHLILSRQVHLDQLADKLREDRVRRVVEPLLSGGDEWAFSDRDLEYVRDLGLIARDAPPRIANPIYAEIVPRELTWASQARLIEDTVWYVDADGGRNVDKLLGAFQAFFREHSEHWLGRFDYAEAGPQLILQAFLQRVVNGGGRIEGEYGLGRGRTDLLIVWPRGGGAARDTEVDRRGGGAGWLRGLRSVISRTSSWSRSDDGADCSPWCVCSQEFAASVSGSKGSVRVSASEGGVLAGNRS